MLITLLITAQILQSGGGTRGGVGLPNKFGKCTYYCENFHFLYWLSKKIG